MDDDLFEMILGPDLTSGGRAAYSRAAWPEPPGEALCRLLDGAFPLANPRHKRAAPGRPFRADKSTGGGRPWAVFVTVPEAGEAAAEVVITDCPWDPGVGALVRRKGTVADLDQGRQVVLRVGPADGPYLRQLAAAVRRVVGPGRRYADPSAKWKARCAADALDRLADALDAVPPVPADHLGT